MNAHRTNSLNSADDDWLGRSMLSKHLDIIVPYLTGRDIKEIRRLGRYEYEVSCTPWVTRHHCLTLDIDDSRLLAFETIPFSLVKQLHVRRDPFRDNGISANAIVRLLANVRIDELKMSWIHCDDSLDLRNLGQVSSMKLNDCRFSELVPPQTLQSVECWGRVDFLPLSSWTTSITRSVTLSNCERPSDVLDLSACSNLEKLRLDWCVFRRIVPPVSVSSVTIRKTTAMEPGGLPLNGFLSHTTTELELMYLEAESQVLDFSPCYSLQRLCLQDCLFHQIIIPSVPTPDVSIRGNPTLLPPPLSEFITSHITRLYLNHIVYPDLELDLRQCSSNAQLLIAHSSFKTVTYPSSSPEIIIA